MAITKDQFKNAFREVVASEYNDIPNNDDAIDYSFSEKFEKNMHKLIKSQKNPYWHFINTSSKKVAVISLICVVIISSALSVHAIREPIVKFFTEVYETFVNFFFEGDTIDEIVHEYQITIIPEGFTKKDVEKGNLCIKTIFEDQDGNVIEFTQTITENTDINVDNEKGDNHIISISGYEVSVYDTPKLKSVMWIKDGYLLDITCYGNIQLDTITAMIETIE